MGRRSDHSREELRTMILDAAEADIADGGLAGLSVRRIAQRIGYSHGTLYTIFEDLDDIVLGVNLRTLTRLQESLPTGSAGTDVVAEVKALAHAYLGFVAANGKPWQTLFEHRMSDGKEVPTWYAEAIARSLRIVEAALAPRFPAAADRHTAAAALWAGLHGIASLSTDGKLEAVTGTPPTALADLLVEGVVGQART